MGISRTQARNHSIAINVARNASSRPPLIIFHWHIYVNADVCSNHEDLCVCLSEALLCPAQFLSSVTMLLPHIFFYLRLTPNCNFIQFEHASQTILGLRSCLGSSSVDSSRNWADFFAWMTRLPDPLPRLLDGRPRHEAACFRAEFPRAPQTDPHWPGGTFSASSCRYTTFVDSYPHAPLPFGVGSVSFSLPASEGVREDVDAVLPPSPAVCHSSF
ncbi:hypothetical protein FB451DRAFT_370030 [Mycena latifolia]|nr:hypothetical protein FB451DRAFT_370030 [Mycena latifolia]